MASISSSTDHAAFSREPGVNKKMLNFITFDPVFRFLESFMLSLRDSSVVKFRILMSHLLLSALFKDSIDSAGLLC